MPVTSRIMLHALTQSSIRRAHQSVTNFSGRSANRKDVFCQWVEPVVAVSYKYEHMCVLCRERERPWKVYSIRIELSRERKVDLMNNTRSYICIQTSTHTHTHVKMTSTTTRDRSSNNVVRTRKTFRWNNKKNKEKTIHYVSTAQEKRKTSIVVYFIHFLFFSFFCHAFQRQVELCIALHVLRLYCYKRESGRRRNVITFRRKDRDMYTCVEASGAQRNLSTTDSKTRRS